MFNNFLRSLLEDKEEKLWEACCEGRTEEVKRILEAHPNTVDWNNPAEVLLSFFCFSFSFFLCLFVCFFLSFSLFFLFCVFVM